MLLYSLWQMLLFLCTNVLCKKNEVLG